MATGIRHPLFARFFDRLSRVIEKDVGAHREELLEGPSGRVVEIGPGNGISFRHYPHSVEEVIAVEPEPYLRARAERAAQAAAINVTVRAGVADPLELPDASVDAAVSSLVLCSVSDQAAALAELHRVLRPGGELRFYEHVRAPGAKARVQSGLDTTIWPLISGGCHCARDTVAAIEAAGFAVERVRQLDVGPSWTFTNPHVIGRARR